MISANLLLKLFPLNNEFSLKTTQVSQGSVFGLKKHNKSKR